MTGTIDKIKEKLHIGSHSDSSSTEAHGTTGTGAHDHHSTATGGSVGTGSHATHNPSVSSSSGERRGSIGEGVARQLFNPNAEKFSEASYGPIGSHSAVETLPPSVAPEAHLYTDPVVAKKEHGVLRQILNPHGDKYDETRFGSTASTELPRATGGDSSAIYSAPEATKDHSVLRQLVNPSGAKYDPVMHGGQTGSNDPSVTYGTAATTETGLSHHQHNTTDPHHHHSDPAASAAAGTLRHDENRDARDAALMGGAVGGSGVVAHEAMGHHHAGESSGLSHHVHNNVYETPASRTDASTAGTGPSTGYSATSGTGSNTLGETGGTARIL